MVARGGGGAGHAAFLRQRRLLTLAVVRESAQVLWVAEELDCARSRPLQTIRQRWMQYDQLTQHLQEEISQLDA